LKIVDVGLEDSDLQSGSFHGENPQMKKMKDKCTGSKAQSLRIQMFSRKRATFRVFKPVEVQQDTGAFPRIKSSLCNISEQLRLRFFDRTKEFSVFEES
jgi:hypothetical protein